jgi:hypothetical protein
VKAKAALDALVSGANLVHNRLQARSEHAEIRQNLRTNAIARHMNVLKRGIDIEYKDLINKHLPESHVMVASARADFLSLSAMTLRPALKSARLAAFAEVAETLWPDEKFDGDRAGWVPPGVEVDGVEYVTRKAFLKALDTERADDTLVFPGNACTTEAAELGKLGFSEDRIARYIIYKPLFDPAVSHLHHKKSRAPFVDGTTPIRNSEDDSGPQLGQRPLEPLQAAGVLRSCVQANAAPPPGSSPRRTHGQLACIRPTDAPGVPTSRKASSGNTRASSGEIEASAGGTQAASRLQWVLWLPEQSKYEPFGSLDVSVRLALEDAFRTAYLWSKPHQQHWGRISRNPRTYCSDEMCLSYLIVRRSSGQMQWADDNKARACSSCVRQNRPCARVVQRDNDFVLCIYPLARPRPSVTWRELSFWLKA